jgi:hypothetical protein
MGWKQGQVIGSVPSVMQFDEFSFLFDCDLLVLF